MVEKGKIMKKEKLMYVFIAIAVGVIAYLLLRKKPVEDENITEVKIPLTSSYIPVSLSGMSPTPSESSMA